MVGEPKKEMYDLLPKHLYPPTFNVSPGEDVDVIKQQLAFNNVSYPFIVKPEIGEQGILLRKINSEEALQKYHAQMPWEYIVQQLVTYPMEVSVFYIRHPNNSKGVVTGFLHKIPLQVLGNGIDTLEELVSKNPKAAKRTDELFKKHHEQWKKVLPAGEQYLLSYAANHNRGAQFVDLKNEIDEKLVALFDNISSSDNEFYYGRYDIMCASVDELKVGRNFYILEYNGCGAEPNHFYDTGYTLRGAYKEILKHWLALYQISKYNSASGIKPWPFKKGKDFLTNSRKLKAAMKLVDAEMG